MISVTSGSAVNTAQPGPVSTGIFKYLVTVLGITFCEFLIMGISLGVLPVFVHNTLGFSNLVVGVVIGVQYLATLCTRHFAGKMTDTYGGKKAVVLGIFLSFLSGVVCLFAQPLAGMPVAGLAVLLAARALLGIGESYLIIGIFSWGFALVGPKNIGRVMVWNGMGMYGGMACGAPLGMLLQSHFSLTAAFAALMLFPLLSFGVSRLLPRVPLPATSARMPFYKAVHLVWKSGAGLALATIGFGGIASFISLLFNQHGWNNASLALSLFGASYILVRLFFAHLPDKIGGASVAMVSLLVEVAGQVLIWQAGYTWMAIAGAALTGAGMSLVFPSFGLIAVKRVPAENRGMAMAAYNAFFDLGMGLTAPLAGLIAGSGNYGNIYIFGSIAAAASAGLAFMEFRRDKAIA